MTSRVLINPLPKNSGVSLRTTIQNPRPRKYASDADRQKAFRERQAVIQVRVKPETVETFDRIASTLGYSRQEVVYALLMSGLNNNRNWQQTGIPAFRLPRYEENPMKRKATPAQLAARERFAEMARSGAFKRKKNPMVISKQADESLSRQGSRGYVRKLLDRYSDEGHVVSVKKTRSGSIGIAFDGGRMLTVASARKKLEDYYGITDTMKRRSNPAKKTVSQKISQLVREGYPQPQAVAIALNEERKGKVKKNPLGVSGGRYEILWAGSGDLKGSYDDLGQAKDFLDDIDRPPGLFYGVDTKTGKRFYSFAAETRMLDRAKSNPAERERKPRVVLITNPKQRMGLIAFRTAGGALTTKEVPILFSFKLPVASNLYGEKSMMDFFAHKDGQEIAVTEKTTGFKLGNIPRVFMAVGRDEKAAAKYFVEDLLKQHGAAKFRAAVESKPKIA